MIAWIGWSATPTSRWGSQEVASACGGVRFTGAVTAVPWGNRRPPARHPGEILERGGMPGRLLCGRRDSGKPAAAGVVEFPTPLRYELPNVDHDG